MVNAQGVKTVVAVSPVSLAATTATPIVIDTQGFNYARYELTAGAVAGVVSVFKITECDTSGGTYTDITDAAPSALPGATDDGKVYGIMMSLGGSRQRYQKVVLTTTGSAGVYGVNAQLSRGDEVPDTATLRGFAAEALIA